MLKLNNACCVLDYSFRKYDSFDAQEIGKIKTNFKGELEKLLKRENSVKFISGMNVGFEMFAAKIVLELKEQYKNIVFECALPDELQAVGWSEGDRESYYNILGKCDIENFISKKSYIDNMKKRNKYMLSSSKNVFIFTDIPNFLHNKADNMNSKDYIMIDTSL
ncbi:MAG TPA: hypothetical protein DC000_02500 [Clostridiales bacterium]|nr:hypothetical protein [Clostridiales bacterium]